MNTEARIKQVKEIIDRTYSGVFKYYDIVPEIVNLIEYNETILLRKKRKDGKS